MQVSSFSGSAMLRNAFAALAVVLVTLLAESSGILDPLDRWLGDARFRIGQRPASGAIVIVDIDSRSLQEIGTWPWPRRIHAELIDKLLALGAAEIVFDIDFSAASNEADDAALTAALERAGGAVLLASFAQAPTGRLDDSERIYNVPIASFRENAWTASVNVIPDRDGSVRSLRYSETIAGVPTQSLSVMLAGYAAPPRGGFPIDFSIQAATVDRVSAIDVLRRAVDERRIEGKKIVVGASAVELRDFFQVPVYQMVSGALLQVLGAETLIQGRVLRSGSDLLRYGGALLITVLFAVSFRRLCWMVLVGCFAFLSIGIEFAAAVLQVLGAFHLQTAVWQVCLIGFAGFTVGSEIDFRRVLLMIARTETSNARTILDQVISDNFAGVLVVNADGTIRAVSRSTLRLLGLDDRSLEGEYVEDVIPPALAAVVRSALKDGDPASGVQSQELRYARADGNPRILEYAVTLSRLSGGLSTEGKALHDHVVATLTFVDVTERRITEDRIAYLARFDTLTGLPNRNQLEEKLQDALEHYRAMGESCAVLFFDLDRFKGVNDTLGHDFGDRLLTAVARRLEEVVRSRPNGDTVARFGGDEYAVLMAGPVGSREAEALAERLITALSEPYELEGHRLIVGLSVGIALPQQVETTVGTLMKNADAALYRAKARGGGAYKVFDESIETTIRAKREMEVELWDAFSRNEFEVLYQPQVDLADREIIGVEALLRWRHTKRGYVSPAEFVPVAEAIGLIEPLGRWVLQQACIEVARWPVPIKVAVNVSPVQFVRGDLTAAVDGALMRSGLPADRLSLEITESLFLQWNNTIKATIQQLRDRGVTFSIDDFGTGYSSLSYVRKFPVQKIKIDQSFVREISHDRESAAIVRAICTLAKGLGISVNAEGIEKAEQVPALRLFGCDEGQGYLFGKPQPAAGIIEILRAQAGGRRRSA